VIGGYTEPEGSRMYFGSIVLGLYDSKGGSFMSARRAADLTKDRWARFGSYYRN